MRLLKFQRGYTLAGAGAGVQVRSSRRNARTEQPALSAMNNDKISLVVSAWVNAF